MSDDINRYTKKYSLDAFIHNVNENLCLFIGGGLEGSKTLCKNQRQERGPYCEHHNRIAYQPFKPMKKPVIKE